MNTLNNDALESAKQIELNEILEELREEQEELDDQIEIDSSEQEEIIRSYDNDKCWNDGKGLSVWDATSRGQPPIDKNGLCNFDVVIITGSTLQSRSPSWITRIHWHSVLADEGHDYLRDSHNARIPSLTLQN